LFKHGDGFRQQYFAKNRVLFFLLQAQVIDQFADKIQTKAQLAFSLTTLF